MFVYTVQPDWSTKLKSVVGLREANLVLLVIEHRVVLAKESVTKNDDRVGHAQLNLHDGDASLASAHALHHIVLWCQLVSHLTTFARGHVDLESLELIQIGAVGVDPHMRQHILDDLRWAHQQRRTGVNNATGIVGGHVDTSDLHVTHSHHPVGSGVAFVGEDRTRVQLGVHPPQHNSTGLSHVLAHEN